MQKNTLRLKIGLPKSIGLTVAVSSPRMRYESTEAKPLGPKNVLAVSAHLFAVERTGVRVGQTESPDSH